MEKFPRDAKVPGENGPRNLAPVPSSGEIPIRQGNSYRPVVKRDFVQRPVGGFPRGAKSSRGNGTKKFKGQIQFRESVSVYQEIRTNRVKKETLFQEPLWRISRKPKGSRRKWTQKFKPGSKFPGKFVNFPGNSLPTCLKR